jgi:DegV family protein with EDD domain
MKEGMPMDKPYAIMTEAACDLPRERFEKAEVLVAPLPITINGVNYQHHPDDTGLSYRAFYRMLRDKIQGVTGAPSPETYAATARAALETGQDVLYLGFTSQLSACYQSAKLALEELKQKFPLRKILMVDTLSGAMGQGLLVELAARGREAGWSIEEAALAVERYKLKVAHYFTVADLHHLRRSGRVGALSAVVGTMLQLKPILALNDKGVIYMAEKVRSYQRALSRLTDLVKEKAVNLKSQIVYISHADIEDIAQKLADKIRALGAREVVVHLLGPVIANHVEPGALGISFLTAKR